MTRAIVVLALLALAAGAARPGLCAEGAAIAATGNGRGAAPCNACHGAHGEGMAAAGYPRLAGVPAPYLEEQLEEFAAGTRASPVMRPIAAALTRGELRAVAEYFAALKPPALPASAGPAPARPAATRDHRQALDLARGAALAERGRWSVGLPACAACHGPDGRGVGDRFPPLAGLPSAYIANQLQAWQMQHRASGPLGLMSVVAMKLTDADIAALAAYYASRGAGASGSSEPLAAAQGPAANPTQRSVPTGDGAAREGRFEPPSPGSEPDDEMGKVIRQGERIFLRPDRYAAEYVGNRLRCSSCHLDAGRRADSAPLWAAYVLYPAYRSKNHHVNTYEERLQGCFRFSMNGRAPPLGSPVLVALEAYSYWLARGAPTGVRLEGQGYPRLPKPQLAPDYARGARVYAERCVLCHGPEGAGQTSRAGEVVFPALWGAGSFNWGAGMASIDMAAGFIEANMPLALGRTLTVQQAWDVALYIDGHERPQDPRFTGSVAETRARYHDSPFSMYGQRLNGRVLGKGD